MGVVEKMTSPEVEQVRRLLLLVALVAFVLGVVVGRAPGDPVGGLMEWTSRPWRDRAVTVAELPSLCKLGEVRIVTDATNGFDCKLGGGSRLIRCRCSVAGWEVLR